MFLYKIEFQGFKSFVDKTELHFGDGITGVIGPNGCGKTNVSDAIRWVMGEQSAKQLRGDSMEDVIFNGCPTRKPLNLAGKLSLKELGALTARARLLSPQEPMLRPPPSASLARRLADASCNPPSRE